MLYSYFLVYLVSTFFILALTIISTLTLQNPKYNSNPNKKGYRAPSTVFYKVLLYYVNQVKENIEYYAILIFSGILGIPIFHIGPNRYLNPNLTEPET